LLVHLQPLELKPTDDTSEEWLAEFFLARDDHGDLVAHVHNSNS
jgi:hypothetical protein